MTNAEKIHALEKECFSDPWSITSIENQLSTEQTIFIIYEENGEAAGFVLGTQVCGEAELYRIGTDPDKRGQGIGASLMKTGISWANGQNAESIFLEVRASNAPAISLYEKHGFENIGIRKKYYTAPIEDAVIMVRKVTEDDNSCS